MIKYSVLKEGVSPSAISGKPCTKIASEEAVAKEDTQKPKSLKKVMSIITNKKIILHK